MGGDSKSPGATMLTVGFYLQGNGTKRETIAIISLQNHEHALLQYYNASQLRIHYALLCFTLGHLKRYTTQHTNTHKLKTD
jgi:hypothetical protein